MRLPTIHERVNAEIFASPGMRDRGAPVESIHNIPVETVMTSLLGHTPVELIVTGLYQAMCWSLDGHLYALVWQSPALAPGWTLMTHLEKSAG